MNKKVSDSYGILRYLAWIAAGAASVATYDIAYSFTPDIFIGGVNIRPFVAGLYMLILDGLYLVLDNRLPHMKTTEAREWTIRFLVLTWAIMAGVNVIDAVLNQTKDVSILGKAGVIIYVLKLIALLYLAYYTFIHYNDPDTQLEIIKRDAAAIRREGVNTWIGKYSTAFSQTGAAVIAMNDFADFIVEETGRHPRDIYGNNWEVTVAKMAGINWPGLASSQEPPTAKSDETPPSDHTGTGSFSDLPEKIREYIPEVIRTKAQRVNASSAKTAPTYHPTDMEPNKGGAPGF